MALAIMEGEEALSQDEPRAIRPSLALDYG